MSSDRSANGPGLPVKPALFHILLALTEGDSHGYGVIVTAREQSQGLIDLPTGTLYRHLAWLIKHGLVEETKPPRPQDDVRRGAYYRLTERGRDLLAAESERLAEVVDLAKSRGILSGRRTA